MIKVFYLLVLMAILSGCATILGEVEDAHAPNPVEFSADYDILDLRIEIFRPYTDTRTLQQQASDHPLTVNIGNGLAIDANGVLFLRVDELLNMDRYEDFTVRTNHDGRRRIIRSGNEVSIRTTTWNPFLWRTRIRYENGTARVGRSIGHFFIGPTEDGFAWAPRNIEQADVTVGPHEDNSFRVGNLVVTNDVENSQITFSGRNLLTRERNVLDRIEFRDDRIIVYERSGLIGSGRAATIYIKEDGYDIRGNNRMQVFVGDDEIVIQSGWLPGWLGGRDRFRLQQ